MTNQSAFERWTNNKLIAALLFALISFMVAGATTVVSHDYRISTVEATASKVEKIEAAHQTWLEWRARYEEREANRDKVLEELKKDVKTILQSK